MKKIMITLLAMCFMITGCKSDEKIMTSAQVKDLFEKHGIHLNEAKGILPENVFLRTLNGIAPESYVINEDQLISIYIYSSGEEAEKGIKDFADKTAQASVVAHSKIKVVNVLIFYVNDRLSRDERVNLVAEDMKSLTE